MFNNYGYFSICIPNFINAGFKQEQLLLILKDYFTQMQSHNARKIFFTYLVKGKYKTFFIKNYPLIEDVIFAWIFFLTDSYYKLKTSWLSDLKPFFSIETFCVFILNTNANTRYSNSFKITLGKTNVPLCLLKIYHKTLLI